MKYLLHWLSVATIMFASPTVNAQARMTHTILVDTHNDALSNELITKVDLSRRQTLGQLDLVRAKEGGLNAQVFSIWCGAEYGEGQAFRFANREIDSLDALIARNGGKMILARNAGELIRGVSDGKFVALIGVEGGHMIEDRIGYIDALVRRGMCYLTLTWNNSTFWATSAADETHSKDSLRRAGHVGLNDYGRQIVRHLNTLGVMVDVSHVGEQTFYDVLAASSKPVIASHSCAYALNPNQRNLKDEQLKALAKNGGVVFVNFYSGFVDSSYTSKEVHFLEAHRHALDSLRGIFHDNDLAKIRLNAIYRSESEALRPPLALLIRHIDYIAKLIGTDHVGIGSDFDGAESFPRGMDDVRDYPKIKDELVKLHYTGEQIDQIFGGNFIRVLRANKGK